MVTYLLVYTCTCIYSLEAALYGRYRLAFWNAFYRGTVAHKKGPANSGGGTKRGTNKDKSVLLFPTQSCWADRMKQQPPVRAPGAQFSLRA